MRDVLEVLKYIGLVLAWVGGLLVVCFVFALIAEIVSAARHTAADRMRRRRSRGQGSRSSSPPLPTPAADESRWSCALLVDVDEVASTIAPHVQLRGIELPPRAHLRVELIDDRGSIRHRSTERLPADALDRHVALPSFRAPDGARLHDVLGWRWDIVLTDGKRERVRWSERLRPVRGLNLEAELDDGRELPMQGTPAAQRGLTADEERLVRAIFGDRYDELVAERRGFDLARRRA